MWWRKFSRLLARSCCCRFSSTSFIMQLPLLRRHACSGGKGGHVFHIRAPLFWLIAAFTIASCFACILMTLSYMSATTSESAFLRFSSSSERRRSIKQTRAAVINNNCAEQQQQAALPAPPTPAAVKAAGGGKIQNPFSSAENDSSLVRYGIIMAPAEQEEQIGMQSSENRKIAPQRSREYRYSDNMPLIFIGGMPRSGTTLMRAMLDAHPEVRCGTETRLVPRILSMRAMWLKSARESTRLHEAGITDDVIDAAVRSFILEIMVRHGELAPRLCNKDPFTLKSAAYLAKLFPHAKFIFMIRDGRATVTSIITRQVTITGFNLNDYKQCMEKWNQAMEAMWAQCQAVGSKRCLPVHYEQVVLHPQEQLRRILDFLELPWNDAVLHHEEHIGESGGVQLSKAERSTDQVIKPVNLDALAKWTETFPDDVHVQLPSVAPMLEVLGYNPLSRNVSQYGLPDKFVALNTDMLAREDGIWRERQLASVLKGSDSYKYLEREYRLQQASSGMSPSQQQQQTRSATGGGGSSHSAAAAAVVVAAPNLKADFDV